MTAEENEGARIVEIALLAAELTNGLKEEYSPPEAMLIVLHVAAGVCALSLPLSETADEAWKTFTHQHSERTFKNAFNRYRSSVCVIEKRNPK